MMNTTRRSFIKTSAAASLAFGATPLLAAKGKKFRTALIGSGWWGMNILREAIAAGRCQVVGLCDVYQRPLVASQDDVAGLTGDEARIYTDYEEMLRKEDRKSVV